ncbi:hypothetical protein [Gordonia sp. (in: high G+C Gram-positive bacteria)]|uniref:hypothetical protein n=1 Tax=Gordonia sp. (in: high G+C Gram-positive bacteria) TaxID=84139 RepID=UPI001696A750|nr:hypothetical protein [Gordonia sp. (in: high G+C Gram-positive bacteria)]NLG47786.1 hypothetical protein [Gordonia sp. (in: high G+C Gram-positive bacteria)]
MAVSVESLELENFETLPLHSRRCVFWEVDRAGTSPAIDTVIAAGSSNDTAGPESEFDKEAWLSGLLLEWGVCCQVAVESTTERVVGAAFYSPPGRVPRAHHFPTAPVGADAVLLTTIQMEPGFETHAVALLDAVVSDLVRRGVRAVEAFGFTGDDESLAMDLVTLLLGSGLAADVCSRCILPTDILKEFGFEVVAEDPYLPRLRLELDEGLGWKSQVERALRKLVETSTPPALAGTVPQPVTCSAASSSAKV